MEHRAGGIAHGARFGLPTRADTRYQVRNKNLKALLDGYDLPYLVADVCKYGVPQQRKRIIVGEQWFLAKLERAGARPQVTPRQVLANVAPAWTGGGPLPAGAGARGVEIEHK